MILDGAATSRKERSDGIKPWTVTSYPDWCETSESKESQGAGVGGVDRDRGRGHDKDLENDDDEEFAAADEVADADTTERIIAAWKDAHPRAQLRYDELTGMIGVCSQ